MNPERFKRVEIPVLPLCDVMVYPHIVIPLFVGREKPIRCPEATVDHDRKIILVTQKEASTNKPGVNDLSTVGTVASILQMLKLPDGTIKMLVEGSQHVRISTLLDNGEHSSAKAGYLESPAIDEWEQEVLMRTAISQFGGYTKLNRKIPPEVLTSLNSIDDPMRLVDTIAAHMPLKLADKQPVLEMSDVNERLEYLMAMMESKIDPLQVEKHIRNHIKKQMGEPQRGYHLNEQMKAIQKELGEVNGAPDENEALKCKIGATKMPKGAREKAEAKLRKLKMISPMSAEATVVRGYIDQTVQVPRNARSKVKEGLRQAQETLGTDHYGLERMKDRILEYLAVQSRVSKIKGSAFYLVGPSGIGKTSLDQSIARATGYKYVRMTLGDVRDEAGIRSHRRTYIGSMSGKLIQKMAKMGVKSPLSLLNEIDKMSSDTYGDPASTLLEVLDPEQNIAFSDHYLGVDYDLSDIMFITTSNFMNIPASLLDRVEVIHLSGCTEDERLNIIRRHLLPRQIEHNVLKKGELTVDDNIVVGIIRYYTREAGTRGLGHEISKLCRKAVKQLLLDKSLKHTKTNGDNLHDHLGVQRFDYGYIDNENRIGQVTSLTWTEVGGNLLTIKAACVPEKGKPTYTGPPGEVVQESVQAALTMAYARAGKLGTNPDFYEKRDIYVHVPEGATPKNGPSAGTVVCITLVSYLTGSPVRADVTMTGEITLRGRVLSIGGLREKLPTAHHGGIKTVLTLFENKRDLEEIPDNIIADLDTRPMRRIEEVLTLALQNEPSGMQVVTAKQRPRAKCTNKNRADELIRTRQPLFVSLNQMADRAYPY